MRTILNLSIPPQTATVIKKRAKMRGFTSTSSYIRFLIDSDNDNLITEKQLLQIAKKADADYNTGKLIKAKSLTELL